jgi:RNA polymerase sigma-70 factor (ECF subfamily)
LAEGPSDQALLERASGGDEEAFVQLYDRHQGPVFRFACRMLGSVELAEDVVHDCFLALMTQPLLFDSSRASLRTYLCGAARNLSLKTLRREGREVGEECVPEPASDAPAFQSLLGGEIVRQVQAAVAALPPLQREVVILVEYQDCSLAEVAEIVGAELGTVKARLHRARRGLRGRLASLRGAPVYKGDVE